MKPLHKSSSGSALAKAAYASLKPTIILSSRPVPDGADAKTPGGALRDPSIIAAIQHSSPAGAMRQQTNWPYFDVPKAPCLLHASPARREALVRELRLALITPAERKREIERTVVEKASELLTAKLRLITRQVWLDLKADVAFQGLRIEDFLSDRTFYRRVAKERARMIRVRREAMLRTHAGASGFDAKVKRIVMKHLMIEL